ncbi:GNAT family N-acetyltransferase [Tessaracoccus sp. MC1756]|uniref:GNAT family N-acetyltransferase n=1 Tax=Tessaracoccus sp. MC1756 TaxID=2760311 RepID=UPI0016021610|nr:GNAT family protein [Tessaracoccus sp. MC1756]MBB1510471.1 GNAT family N-acetyltransferase [Tessaracoccus sp. MC1756]
MVATPPEPKTLSGRLVRLEPFSASDADELAELVLDPRLHEHGFAMYPPPRSYAEALRRVYSAWAAQPAAHAARVTWVVRLTGDGDLGPAGTLVGASSLGEAEPENEAVHLGWTVYGRRWWGTLVNAETKYLLLREAFENLGFGRVRLQTDALNLRSQAAIEKFGATREGVLRRHKVRADGTFRDTVVYSILRDEWPAVKTGLEKRLSA